MFAKLLKLLSGIAAVAGRGRGATLPPCPDTRAEETVLLQELAVLDEKYRSLRDTNVALVRERRDLRNQLRRAESRADGVRGDEYAEELDRAKAFLQDAHGFSVSRMQVASAVEDLSRRLDAMGSAARKAECGSCRGSGLS